MNKKILKAMFKHVAETADPIRPMLRGVHFEAERCYATDTHILIIYNQGNEKLSGQTVAFNGDIIKGVFPNVDRVMPKEMPFGPLSIDMSQLYRALKWYVAQPDTLKDDVIAFGSAGYNLGYMLNTLAIYDTAGELNKCQLYLNEPGRPAKFISESLTSILMPVQIDENAVDAPRADNTAIVSYDMLINRYASNCWKKKEVAEEMAWL